MNNFLAPIVSVLAGGALASAGLVGLISSQTSAPEQSPANAEAPAWDYGATE
ncbi:MAG: hypothetical protein LT071_08995 [Nocardioides sp.]|nr:hypothetical protein [Nocardioides sp.]